jgi:hypothetical protein
MCRTGTSTWFDQDYKAWQLRSDRDRYTEEHVTAQTMRNLAASRDKKSLIVEVPVNRPKCRHVSMCVLGHSHCVVVYIALTSASLRDHVGLFWCLDAIT